MYPRRGVGAAGAGRGRLAGRRSLAVAVLAVGLLGGVGGPAAAAPGDTLLLSRATGAEGAKARGSVYGASGGLLSADGQHAAFSSDGPNLDPADIDPTSDVFMRDVRAQLTTLVSRADGRDGAKGNAESLVSAVSADGRFVLFRSQAWNLDPVDGDGAADFYIRDLATHETTLVSRADGVEGAKGNGASGHGRLSGDGRYVAFDSTASNLDPADGDDRSDVFVRDLASGETTLVTPESEAAELAALSASGSRVAYILGSFGEGDTDTIGVLYVRDLRTGEVWPAGRADGTDGATANGFSSRSGVTLSTDGRLVAFSSRASNLDPADRDREEDVYVRDLVSHMTTLVSRADGPGGAKGNRESPFGGSLSADGRFVAFTSYAWNLDPLDAISDADWDVFVRDLRTGQTVLASRSSSGAKGNGRSPSLSADGHYLAFSSDAHNLDPVDRDYRHDLYRRDLRARLPVPGRPPRSRIDGVRRGEYRLLIVGRARDDHGIQRIEVSVTRRIKIGSRVRCQAAEGEFWLPTRRSRRGCKPRFLLPAHFTRTWQRGIPIELPGGTYTLTSRATDTAGQRERRFSVKRGNIRNLQVR